MKFLLPLFFLLGQFSWAGPDITADLSVPANFKITVFQSNIHGARSLALGEKGTVFVGTKIPGMVHAIHKGKDFIIASNLNLPNGVFFYKGSLYVAEVSRILRFDKIEENLSHPPKPLVVSDSLPKGSHHDWKFIAVGPDEKLYISVGAPCNVCLKKDPRYAAILRMDLDGKNSEVYEAGIRNSVGFDWDPATKDLWFSDNGRDWMGDDIPPCELNHATQKGQNFGFPFCHGGDVLDPQFGKGKKCKDFVAPVVKLPAHSSPLGLRFYRGRQFPAEYKNNIFMAEHGSWNRKTPIGYRVSRVQLKANGDALSYTGFVEGFLSKDGKVLGRPVDLLNMPDGSLLISDDMNGTLYKVSYTGEKK